jgi:NADPH:quinone reductase-like Zn-dependent oxidoreductase
MPKKKTQETQAEQSARFLAEVGRLIAAGELDPTEAERALDKLVRNEAHRTK